MWPHMGSMGWWMVLWWLVAIVVLMEYLSDYTKMTIEHIAPENPPSGSATVDGVGRLGNLLLLDEGSNNKVGNKTFAEKKQLYKGAAVPSQ